jgi:hypothetical protein
MTTTTGQQNKDSKRPRHCMIVVALWNSGWSQLGVGAIMRASSSIGEECGTIWYKVVIVLVCSGVFSNYGSYRKIN